MGVAERQVHDADRCGRATPDLVRQERDGTHSQCPENSMDAPDHGDAMLAMESAELFAREIVHEALSQPRRSRAVSDRIAHSSARFERGTEPVPQKRQLWIRVSMAR